MQFFRGSENDPSNHLESDGRFSDRPRGGFSLETQTVMEPAVLEFWLGYLDRLPPDLDHPPKAASVFSFGDSRELADELSTLVRQGIKTATCSALLGYDIDQKPLPQTGELSVVLDGSGNPVLIIQTIEVFVLPFNEVSDQFAFDEGEGDRSLAYWRKAHENYFRRNDFKDRAFDERVPVVCERFRVVHPID
jgi:uncharacterized protein YhfF